MRALPDVAQRSRVSGFKSQNEFLWPAELGMTIKDQKKKEGSADKPLALFARLAFTSPGKKCDKQLSFIVRVGGSNNYCFRFLRIFFKNDSNCEISSSVNPL